MSVAFLVTCISQGICQQDSLIERIKTAYDGSATLTTSFDLRILWKVREKEETRHGTIILGQNDRFHIELGTTSWICDGRTVWQYDKSASQVIVKPLAGVDLSMLPSHAVSAYLSKYPLRRKAERGSSVVYEWIADSFSQEKKTEASLVRIDVDAKKAIVKKLFVIDKNGNESTYAFHATSAGAAVPKHSFEFSIPKGASVLDESK